jgi:hypothetical protein
MKRSSSPGLPSSPDISQPKAEPTVEPVSPSNKPRAENPIQVAERTPPSAFQILMSGKRTHPWLASPPKGFLERVSRTQTQMQVNIDDYGLLPLAN